MRYNQIQPDMKQCLTKLSAVAVLNRNRIKAAAVAMVALVAGNAAAETYTNYFVDGTEWYISGSGMNLENDRPKDVTTRIWLEKAPEDWNLPDEGLLVYISNEDSEKEYVAGFIKCEDEKVYFTRHPRFDEWLLLYDFSLTEGAFAQVYEMNTLWPNTYNAEQYNEICVGETSVEGWPELQAIRIEEDYDEGEGTTVWIRGIGCIESPLKNCQYGSWIGASSSTLEKVVHNGVIVYQRSAGASVSGIPSDESGEPLRYSINGRKVDNPAKGEMYVENGKTYIK